MTLTKFRILVWVSCWMSVSFVIALFQASINYGKKKTLMQYLERIIIYHI